MTVFSSDILRAHLNAEDGCPGRVDDLYFDVRTGDITHMSVALNGWYRGNIVLIPVDSCAFRYGNGGVYYHNLSAEQIRKAPLLDDEAAFNAEVADLVTTFEDAAPCWSFSGRCCVNTTRSESIENKTHQPALWGCRDLIKAEVVRSDHQPVGRIHDLEVDTTDWRIAGLRIRHGHWFWPEWLEIPMEKVYEVEKHGALATVVLKEASAEVAA